jgi:ppGpp synthetase/RelA/SpoT-type nucleotidyltranferase
MKPTPYSAEGYAKWHDSVIKDDRPILDRLKGLRDEMMAKARPDLELLYELLVYMFTYARNEYKRARGQEATYQTPLSELLPTDPAGAASPRYETLFKSITSVVNKMWRKATDRAPTVTLANILPSITDLIRTDVRTETLDGAQFLAHRMNDLPDLLYNDDLRAQYAVRVESAFFEPEMKMASGYFAYHGLVRFKSGYIVEVQIYSALMSEWRKLSHQLYERARVEPIPKHEFASPESRLISLGHALHLAECEIQRLRQEIEKR